MRQAVILFISDTNSSSLTVSLAGQTSSTRSEYMNATPVSALRRCNSALSIHLSRGLLRTSISNTEEATSNPAVEYPGSVPSDSVNCSRVEGREVRNTSHSKFLCWLISPPYGNGMKGGLSNKPSFRMMDRSVSTPRIFWISFRIPLRAYPRTPAVRQAVRANWRWSRAR